MIRSAQFDDIYFSAQDGLAESRHVFLGGNNLPEAWANTARFCIAETGFGTGLNMLAAWQLFEETAKPGQRLDLISIEKYPLSVAEIREALAGWADMLSPYMDRMLALYPMRVAGFHQLHLSDRVTLTLIFDDVHMALPDVRAQVDAWFLDGFAPAKNPDMWTQPLYSQMARLSHASTTFATFTAARDVLDGLEQAGFRVAKAKGHGLKRKMTAGYFDAGHKRIEHVPPRRVAIVGAGLAGLSAAWHMRRAGCDVRVYESADAVGMGASGNVLALINPKLTAKRSAASDYYTAGYAYALRMVTALPDIGFSPHGSLHLQLNDDKARRFNGYTDNLGWAGHMQLLDEGAASDVAGIKVNVPALYYPDAAAVGPHRLCQRMAEGLDVRTGTAIQNIDDADADVVVLANAKAVTQFMALPVGSVRGQISMLAPCDASRAIKTNICYGGYLSPLMAAGYHVCGATFQPWGTSPDVHEDDHIHNLGNLYKALPALDGAMTAIGGRTGFRASSKDRLPIVGAASGAFGSQGRPVYLSVAHGSHGVVSGLMAGAVLAAQIAGGPLPVGVSAFAALAPARFE